MGIQKYLPKGEQWVIFLMKFILRYFVACIIMRFNFILIVSQSDLPTHTNFIRALSQTLPTSLPSPVRASHWMLGTL